MRRGHVLNKKRHLSLRMVILGLSTNIAGRSAMPSGLCHLSAKITSVIVVSSWKFDIRWSFALINCVSDTHISKNIDSFDLYYWSFLSLVSIKKVFTLVFIFIYLAAALIQQLVCRHAVLALIHSLAFLLLSYSSGTQLNWPGNIYFKKYVLFAFVNDNTDILWPFGWFHVQVLSLGEFTTRVKSLEVYREVIWLTQGNLFLQFVYRVSNTCDENVSVVFLGLFVFEDRWGLVIWAYVSQSEFVVVFRLNLSFTLRLCIYHVIIFDAGALEYIWVLFSDYIYI